ncbi:MAG: helix-turn-helix transcriptional regulator [Clostridia bacterium]|nr:helix-turn-helix transcriptional regulator [Clostridia bacterium]
MTIYEKIRFLREQKGLSQQELAEKVGYKTASAINKIELGLRDLNQTKIISFAKALNTTPSFLMGWSDEPVQQKTPPIPDGKSELINEIIRELAALPQDKQQEVLRYIRFVKNG